MVQLSNLSCIETSSEQKSARTLNSAIPQLWVDSLDYLGDVPKHFNTKLPDSEPGQGDHIIALGEERDIRRLVRKIQRLSSVNIKILPPEQLLFDVVSIAIKGVPLDTWYQLRKDSPIELEEGLKIAADILQAFSDSEVNSTQKNLELEALRRRCDVNSFDWNKYIADLEKDIHAAVDGKGKTDPAERKRLELKAIAQERDPYKFTDKLIEFCRRTGWTRRDVEQQIRLLKTSTIVPKAKRLKGKDFLALETESISWVFPGIIPSRGVFVVGGHAGAGKTTLAYDAVGSLLLGEEFLGEKPVKVGKVLIVTGDELPCFTQDKLIDRGIPLENEDWEIILNWDVSQWNELEEAIADIRPALVVIDSFSSIHRDPSFDENSSQAKSTIYDLEALTNAYGCGCILIHHLSKSKDNQGVAKLRGSSAISAAASVVCLMEQTSDGSRKLSFPKIRGAQTEPFLATLDGSTGRYKVVSGGDDAGIKTLGSRILAFLQKYPYQRFEQDEISRTLGIPSTQKDSVYQALGRLHKRGLITKRPSKFGGKRKVYGVANPSQLSHTEGLRTVTDTFEDTHPPLPDKVSVQIYETVDTHELEVTDSLTDTLTDTKLTPQNDVPPVSDQNLELEGISAKLTDTDSQGGVCPLLAETVTPLGKPIDLSLSDLVPLPPSLVTQEVYQVWSDICRSWELAVVKRDNGFGSVEVSFSDSPNKVVKVPRAWVCFGDQATPQHPPKGVK